MTAPQKEQTQPGGAGSQGAHDCVAGESEHSSSVPFSRGNGAYDATPAQQHAPTFDDFVEYVLADRGLQKGEQWISCAFRVAPDDAKHRASSSMARNIGRNHRCRDCALPRNFVGLDADGLTPEQSMIVVEWLHGHLGVVYATASHTPLAPRLRALLMLDEALGRSDLIRASASVRSQIDGALLERGLPPVGWDDSCDRPEQPLYLPLHDAWAVRLTGQPLVAKRLVSSPLLGDMLAPITLSAASAHSVPPEVVVDPYAALVLNKAAQAIAAAPHGMRNDVLNREGFAVGGMVGAHRLDRSTAAALLIETTRLAGWENDAKNRATVLGSIASGMAAPRTDGLPSAISFAIGKPANDEDAPPRLKVVDLSDLRNARVPRPDFLMRPLIPKGVVTLFAGHGGTGKSMLGLTMAAHIACGADWARFKTEKAARVLFASMEDSGDVVLGRLQVIADYFHLDLDSLDRNLVVVDGAEMDAALVTEVNEYGTRRLRPTALLEPLQELADGAELIVIDNASDTFDGDENNRRQVRFFMRMLASLARASSAGLILLAHIDKNAAVNGAKGNSYSGSTAWHNSARSRLSLTEDLSEGDDKVWMVHEKANLGPKAPPVAFRRVYLNEEDAVLVVDEASDGNAPGSIEAAKAKLEADAAVIVEVLKLAEASAIDVPAAMSGPATALHTLATFPELPRELREGKKGRKRFGDAITYALRERRLRKEEIKTASRNSKEVLRLVPEPTQADCVHHAARESEG